MSGDTGAARPWWLTPLATLGALGLAGFVLILVLIIWNMAENEPQRPAIVQARAAREVFTVGNVGRLPGSRLIRLDVSAGEGEVDGYSSYSAQDQRNIVLLDPATGRSRRLLPDNSRRIIEHEFHSAEPERPNSGAERSSGEITSTAAPPAYYHLILAHRDGRSRDLVVGRLSDGARRLILPSLDGVDSIWTQDATHLGIVAREGRRLTFRLINVRAMVVSPPKMIAID
jgi:hypothetical protein